MRRILTEYANWAAERSPVPECQSGPWRTRIEILLNARADYLEKRDPTYWRSGDVHELLIQYCGPGQVDYLDLSVHGPAAVRDYLEFLDQTERLHPGSSRVAALIKELDRLTPKFAGAMADRSTWWLAKRVFAAMLADGVDIEDVAQVDRWAEKFSSLDARARRPVLGELMDPDPAGFGNGAVVIHDGQAAVLRPGVAACKQVTWDDAPCGCGQCPAPSVYPAVHLPGDRALADGIADYGGALLRRLITLADWTGEQGQPVGRHAELSRDGAREAAAAVGIGPSTADSRQDEPPALARLRRLGLEIGILDLRRTRMVRGPVLDLATRALHGAAPPGEALGLWCGLFDEIVKPAQVKANSAAAPLAEWMGIWPTLFLGHLYERTPHGEDASVAEIMDDVLRANSDRMPRMDPEAFRGGAAMATRLILSFVADHGGAGLTGDSLTEPLPERALAGLRTLDTEPWVLLPEPGLRVRLTGLGRYAIRERLLAEGAAAPAIRIEPGA
jgi:hypothetical protein